MGHLVLEEVGVLSDLAVAAVRYLLRVVQLTSAVLKGAAGDRIGHWVALEVHLGPEEQAVHYLTALWAVEVRWMPEEGAVRLG